MPDLEDCAAYDVGFRIELGGFDERGDDRPVVTAFIAASKSALLQLRALGRIERSSVFESISLRPSSRNFVSPALPEGSCSSSHVFSLPVSGSERACRWTWRSSAGSAKFVRNPHHEYMLILPPPTTSLTGCDGAGWSRKAVAWRQRIVQFCSIAPRLRRASRGQGGIPPNREVCDPRPSARSGFWRRLASKHNSASSA